jgi:hypothetical protein
MVSDVLLLSYLSKIGLIPTGEAAAQGACVVVELLYQLLHSRNLSLRALGYYSIEDNWRYGISKVRATLTVYFKNISIHKLWF